MWPHLDLDRYGEFLQEVLSQDDLAPEFIRRNRQICKIIDAMTPDERRTVLPALARPNIERIAFDTGVPQIAVATFLTWYVNQVHDFNFKRRRRSMWSDLCDLAHAKLLLGKCPWCGKSISHGNIAS